MTSQAVSADASFAFPTSSRPHVWLALKALQAVAAARQDRGAEGICPPTAANDQGKLLLRAASGQGKALRKG